MQGILYRTKVPKFSVVAPIKKANNTENSKQNNIIGSLKMVFKNRIGPAVFKTNKKKNMSDKLSSEESSVEIFFDSHI